jgi:hypothetical protein
VVKAEAYHGFLLMHSGGLERGSCLRELGVPFSSSFLTALRLPNCFHHDVRSRFVEAVSAETGGGAGCGSPFRAGRVERGACEPVGMAGDVVMVARFLLETITGGTGRQVVAESWGQGAVCPESVVGGLLGPTNYGRHSEDFGSRNGGRQ